MYKSFFGLKKNPFNGNPDPSYLYLTPVMRQALEELTYGIQARKGLMLLTGEAGTGKTTLINHVLVWLAHQRAHTAFIFNSHLDSAQLLDFIVSDFEVPVMAQNKTNPLLAFNDWLLARHRAHELVVLIVDEAQGLPVHVLEEIRLLSNMETPDEKLLQIVLVGQPELETKLKRGDLRQLQQRLSLRCKTWPLSLRETSGYVADRLHTAGYTGAEPLFSAEALETLHGYSRGIPRVINLLCENALIHGYVEQTRSIAAGVIDEVAHELQIEEGRPDSRRLRSIVEGRQKPDLQSVLSKIKADAEGSESDRMTAAPPVLAMPQRSKRASEAGGCETEEPSSALPMVAKTVVIHSNAGGPAASAKQVYWARRKRWPAVGDLSNAAKELYAEVNIRGNAIAAGRLLGDCIRRAEQTFARRAQKIVRPGEATASHSDVVNGEARTAGRHNRAARVQDWAKQRFAGDAYGTSLVGVAGLSVMLYLIARKLNYAGSWQHPVLMIVVFAGFLSCAIAMSLGAAILVRERRKVRENSSRLIHRATRWLRAPIPPIQMGHLGFINGKRHGQRKAS